MPDTRPNLLFIFTDEQRADTIAAYGNSRIETPVLNRLTEESTVFESCYVTQAVCTPSRSTIMTGLWPHTNGCTRNNVALGADTKCLPEMLPAGEYFCGYHGKWHLGDEIFRQHGFDEWVSVEDMYTAHYTDGRDHAARSDYHHWLVEHGKRPGEYDYFNRGFCARLPEELSKPAFLAQTASRFIRENRERPWALYVNFLEPHMPFFGPRDDQHPVDEVTLPANFDSPPVADQPLKARLLAARYREAGHSGLPLTDEADWRRMIANYWGLCSLVDTHLGTILDTLTGCGLDENTIVVYTSDHGDMMGSHRLIAKCVQFEEALRVPLIVRLPEQAEPRRVGGPVSQIDLVPTLLELMGADAPGRLQGESLAGLARGGGGEAPRSERDVFVEWNGPNTGIVADSAGVPELSDAMLKLATPEAAAAAVTDPVRTVVTSDGWKLNASPLGEHELYDLNSDPLEKENLFVRAEHSDRIADLASRIRAWQERTGDEVGLPEL